jgi:hypothetical protein
MRPSMLDSQKDKIIFLLLGMLIGIFVTSFGGITVYKVLKGGRQDLRFETRTEMVKKTAKARPIKELYLSFEDKNDLELFKPAENSSFEISDQNATHGRNSLMVKIRPGSDYPGLVWEVYGRHVQNWSNSNDFHFDVYNNTEDSVSLNVKFKSGRNYPKKSFSRLMHLEPLQMNHIKIPIQDIAYTCDITEMSYVKLFVDSPKKEIVLFFDNIGTVYRRGAELNVSDGQKIAKGKDKANLNETLSEGFDVFIASSLDRIFRDGKTLAKPTFSEIANVSMAKNEYESIQIVVKNGRDALNSVEIGISDLIGKNTGEYIDKQNITWRIVKHVRTKKPYYTVKFVGLWPDPLMPSALTDIKAGATQPFWITVYVPKETPGGIYNGTITIRAKDIAPLYIPFSIKVFDFTLPKENNLKTAFDFYPHITASRYPQKEKETKEAYDARIARFNEQYIVDMLKHRINPILNIDPLSQADLGRVDRYRMYGLNNFSIGRRGGTFNNNWPKSDEEIDNLFSLYRTYGENLKINRMINHHYIYTWDEGEIGNPQVAKVTSMLHRAHPELKNMVCYHGFWNPDNDPEWGKDIDIWCFGIGDFNEEKMRKLETKGMEMWMYISGPANSGEPNLAIDFDSIDYRIIPWLCWKYNIKGFLYWCVNWWPYVDPFESASNTKWNQNGNGLLYYPGENGPIASLRLEVFRDGMEDYEYLVLLKNKVNALREKNLELKHLDIYKKATDLSVIDRPIANSMRSFTKDNEILFQRRNDIADMIEKIDRILKSEKDKKWTKI